MKLRHKHVWSCDKARSCRQFASTVLGPEIVYSDVTTRKPDQLGDIDFYAFSPPCQTFSSLGNQEGEDDSDGKGQLVKNALKVIKEKKPRLAIMENVKALATHKKYTRTYNKILKTWKGLGYNVYSEVMLTSQHGVPHSRSRVYVVGIRQDSLKRPFEFPEEIPLKFTAMSVLTRSAQDKPKALPENSRERKLVKAACQKLLTTKPKIDPRKRFVAVDIGCTPQFACHTVTER
eukprot:6351414-Pyramimonas_sp.AAC.3